MNTPGVNKAVRCDACDITLNSPMQAQQHYTGKGHVKRMRKLQGGSDEDEKKGTKNSGKKRNADGKDGKSEEGRNSSEKDGSSDSPGPPRKRRRRGRRNSEARENSKNETDQSEHGKNKTSQSEDDKQESGQSDNNKSESGQSEESKQETSQSDCNKLDDNQSEDSNKNSNSNMLESDISQDKSKNANESKTELSKDNDLVKRVSYNELDNSNDSLLFDSEANVNNNSSNDLTDRNVSNELSSEFIGPRLPESPTHSQDEPDQTSSDQSEDSSRRSPDQTKPEKADDIAVSTTTCLTNTKTLSSSSSNVSSSKVPLFSAYVSNKNKAFDAARYLGAPAQITPKDNQLLMPLASPSLQLNSYQNGLLQPQGAQQSSPAVFLPNDSSLTSSVISSQSQLYPSSQSQVYPSYFPMYTSPTSLPSVSTVPYNPSLSLGGMAATPSLGQNMVGAPLVGGYSNPYNNNGFLCYQSVTMAKMAGEETQILRENMLSVPEDNSVQQYIPASLQQQTPAAAQRPSRFSPAAAKPQNANYTPIGYNPRFANGGNQQQQRPPSTVQKLMNAAGMRPQNNFGGQPNFRPRQPMNPMMPNMRPPPPPPLNQPPSLKRPAPSQPPTSKLDPVSQAVYDNMMGTLPRKRKMEIPCTVCELVFNSESQAQAHFSGAKHIRKAKGLPPGAAITQDENEAPSQTSITSSYDNPAKTKTLTSPTCRFECKECGVYVNSSTQLHQHFQGGTHKKKMGELGVDVEEKKLGDGEVAGNRAGWFYCTTCDISTPTPALLKQHVKSDWHVEMLKNKEKATSNETTDEKPAEKPATDETKPAAETTQS